MIRWTSTPVKIIVYGNTLAQASTVKCTIRQGTVSVSKTVTPVADGANAVISMPITVQEAAGFSEGIAEVQVMWKTGSVQSGSLVTEIDILKVLNEEAL